MDRLEIVVDCKQQSWRRFRLRPGSLGAMEGAERHIQFFRGVSSELQQILTVIKHEVDQWVWLVPRTLVVYCPMYNLET